MKMLRNGADKNEIFDKTGHVVGVFDASFSVKRGEIFVIMGLSGSGKSTMVRLRSEEHTSELQSLMRISYAAFCLKTKQEPSTKDHVLTRITLMPNITSHIE